ncbi:thymidylate synthase [Kitasatospora sp. NPDC051853]|uniref:thymidylate synthase n=1 Tax=Kitasatospora sp. NPDC051853 TaxID=3364058 RepID=UPI00379875C7
MLAAPTLPSFQRAYGQALEHLVTTPQFTNQPRGNHSQEALGLSFTITDPRARTLFLESRPVNPIYHHAEALWYLGGRNDLDMIGYYAPRRRLDSADGTTIDGSAYGKRMFNGPFDQVLALLRSEADSKRAFLPVFWPGALDDPASPDVPCLVGLQLLAREGKLHMVAFMRANDANRGLIADVFSFTFIQEFTARLLGLELGTYTHHVGSMHLAVAELPRLTDALTEAAHSVGLPPRFTPTSMPADSGWGTIRQILVHEQVLRTNQMQYTAKDIAALGLPSYWQETVRLFEVQRQLVHCAADPVDAELLAALTPAHRWQVARRWPRRMPAEVTG